MKSSKLQWLFRLVAGGIMCGTLTYQAHAVATWFKAESDGNLNNTNNWTGQVLPTSQNALDTLSNAPNTDLRVRMTNTFPGGGNMQLGVNPQGKAIYWDMNGQQINANGNGQHGFYSYRQNGTNVGCTNSLIVLSNGMYVSSSFSGTLNFMPFYGLKNAASTNNEWRWSNVRADLNIINVGDPTGSVGESNRMVITDGSMVTVRQFVAVGAAGNLTANRDKPFVLYVKGGSWLMPRGTNALNIGGFVGTITPGKITYGGILSIEDAGSMLLVTNGTAYVGKWETLNNDADRCSANYCQLRVMNGGGALIRDLQIGYGGFTNQLIRTNNSLLVSGAGSFLNVTNLMGVGYYTNSRMSLAEISTGGRLAVTNTGSPAVLWVSNGTLKVNGGTVDVDRLVMPVGSTGLLWNGRMNVATGYVDSLTASVVGDGTGKMVYAPSAADRTNVFTTRLLVMANAELAGVGNIVTPAFTNEGTISPAESTTVGKLTLTAASKWNGGAAYRVNIADVAGAPGTGYDRVDMNGALAIAAATGSKMTIQMVETGVSGFSDSTDYDWTIGYASGGITTNNDWYTFDNSAFYPLAGGVFSVRVTNSNYLVVHYAKPSGGVPNPPTLNAASGVTGWKFVANWATGGGGTAAGYLLDVSTDSAFGSFVGAYHDLALGLVTTYTVSGLTPGTAYYYRMRATNTTGRSDYSGTNTVTTPVAPDVVNPFVTNIFSSYATLSADITNIHGAAVSQRGFTWGDFPGFDPAAGTKVFENDAFGTGGYSLVATGMPVGVDVYYRGYAINAGGTNYTDEQTFLTGPESPGSLAATNVWLTTFDANWAAPLGVSVAAYYLDVSSNANFATYQGVYSNLNVGVELTYPITNLTSAIPYYYRVRAVRDPDGALSTNSGMIAVTTVNADCRWTSTVSGVFSDTTKWLNGLVPLPDQRAWFMASNNAVTVEFDGSKTNLCANFFNGTNYPITLAMGPGTVWCLTNTTVTRQFQIGSFNEDNNLNPYAGYVRQTNGTVILGPTANGGEVMNVGQRKTGIFELDGGVMRVMDGQISVGRGGYALSSNSRMILTNGATLQKFGPSVGLVVGVQAASNTSFVVDDSTAYLTSLNALPLNLGGAGGCSNTIEIRNRGLLQIASGWPTGCQIGQTTTNNLAQGGPSNVLRVTSGGRLFVTNTLAPATALTVVDTNNLLFIDGGTVTVDRIQSAGYVSLANGKLVLKGIGPNTFANGLTVPANAILEAQGTIAGTATVAGVFSPAGVGTAGSIVFSNGLSFGAGSTLDVDVYYSNGTNQQDHISIQGDVASYDVTCALVFNTNVAYQLVSQGSYNIITNADGKLTGTVTPVGLPAGWAMSQDAYQVTLTRNDSPAQYVINATGGAHGTVTPSGAVTVSQGRDQAFTFTAATYYNLSQIWTNGVLVSGGVTNTNSTTFTWLNVVAPGTVTATQVALVATNNNTPLWWLAQYGLTAANELANSDNDGQANYLEYIAGTDPTNGASYWQQETVTVGNTAVIMWTNIADRTYHVYYKTNLVDTTWTQAAAYTNRPAGTIAYTNDNANLLRYYRVTVVNTNK